jgi:hypothetical protein
MLRAVAVQSTSLLDVPCLQSEQCAVAYAPGPEIRTRSESEGWDREEVDRNHAADVVLKESSPTL